MKPEDYTTVRCGMNISKALIEGTIDGGIGLENSKSSIVILLTPPVQQVEVR
jgi:hypothetical protein